MHFNARGGVSVLDLIIYIPSLILALTICVRHGFGRNSGWIYLAIFALIRTIGAILQLATYSSSSSELYKWTAIIDSIAISPLLLATLGLLSRAADSIVNGPFRAAHFRVVQVLITVGLILSIAGGTSSSSSHSSNPSDSSQPTAFTITTTSKVGIILYIVAYIFITLLTARTVFSLSSSSSDEKRLVLAVGVALPLILIRLTYSILAAFTHNHDFNLFTGSVAIYVVMAVLEQYAVVGIYLLVGLVSPVIPRTQQGPILTRPRKGGNDGGEAGFKGGVSRGRERQGIVGNLVSLGADAMRPSG
jgi:hypothetical protein